MYTNICSLNSKFDLLTLEINKQKPTFVLLTETWLKSCDKKTNYELPGYTLHRLDRKHGVRKGDGGKTRGGGVAVYSLQSLNGIPIIVKPNNSFMSDITEALYLDVRFGTYHFLLVVVYRAGNENDWITKDQKLFENLKRASLHNTVIVAGDFNYPDITWPLTMDQKLTDQATLFQEHFLDSDWHQVVTQATRFRTNQTPSLLDLVMTNEEELITNVDYLPPIGKSDHCIISFHVQYLIDAKAQPLTYKRMFNKIDFEKFIPDLKIQLQSVDPNESVHVQWDQYKSAILMTLDKHAPLTPKKPTKYNRPWINKDIVQLTGKKKILWDAYREDDNDENYENYRQCNNEIVNETRRQRAKYEANILEGSDKAFYNHLRNCMSSKVGIPPAVHDNLGNLVTDPVNIAEAFAQEFFKAYSQEPPLPNDLKVKSGPLCEEVLSDITFTPAEVLKILQSLKTDSASGPDNIPGLILKECAEVIAPVLACLINKSFSSGELPSDWKHAVVTPIYKKGDKLNPANYRPISLTSIICKCMERLILNKLKSFLYKGNLIPPQQHGFVEKRSTITNLLYCLDKWSQYFDNHDPLDIFYLDFERAFDKVPHRRLLLKLKHFGIQGALLKWIESYLTGRTFQVKVGNSLSSRFDVLSGVPQGAVLAPTLFGIFVTDLCSVFQSESCFFADDVKYFGNPRIQSGSLREDLDRIQEWTKDWIIKLNPAKCSVLHIGGNNPLERYQIGNTPVASTSVQKDLGVLISSNLKWGPHIEAIVKKANCLLYAIRKSFQHINIDCFLKIYKTYVRPLLEYGFQIWNPYFAKDIDLLESVQRKATRIPYQLRKKTYEQRLEILKLPTLSDRRKRGDVIEVYKILSGKYNCPGLQDILNKSTVHRSRHSNNIQLARTRSNTNVGYNTLNNRVISFWNRLPQEIVDAPSTNAFKNRLDKWLQSNKL